MVFLKFTISIFFIINLAQKASAQLCQGSLGDPIVNITFGSGSNPGGALAAATTSYQFITNDCPQDGFYSVRNNTVGCFGNTWHTLNSDHTGNNGGYFMLVNASFQTGAFYVDTVRGLCGNTTYEFASWIMNILVPSACSGNNIQPNLTFIIEKTDGTILGSYVSGNIAPTAQALWRQYGFYFTTPPSGSDIVLRIVNNAPGGCGNDLILDDITFRPCGPQITSTINSLPVSSVSVCQGQAATFLLGNTISGGFINAAYQWQVQNTATGIWADILGATTNTYTVLITGTTQGGLQRYRLAVAEAGNLGSPQCRVYSNSFSVQVNSLPVTTASNNGPVCTGGIIELTAFGGTQYNWSGRGGFSGSGSPLTLVATANSAGTYYVNVKNDAGCNKTDSTIVTVNPSPVASTSFDSVEICAGQSVSLSAGGGITFQWFPATGLSAADVSNPVASPINTTTYGVIISNVLGCKDTVYVLVKVIPKPVANAGPDKLIFSGQSVQLSATVSGNANFIWSPSLFINDVNVLQPIVNPAADAVYVLNATSSCGTSTDTALVKVYNGLYIPNVFTPNGDGLNDTWNIPAIKAFPNFEIIIYGRWGEQVFYVKNKNPAWDGKFKGSPLPMAAYFYLISLPDGRKLRGSIMLIR